jgi:ADP-ribose pyrophosphatase YjhB (NUDIX family)
MTCTSSGGVGTPRFCANCGHALATKGTGEPSACVACHRVNYVGPRLLVLSLIFANDKMLLMRRRVPPYIGCWAPPGGFVEANESLEGAAARETAEEVGIAIATERLIPHAIISLPLLNQVHVCFLGLLTAVQEPKASSAESMEARWFTLDEYPHEEMWDPATGLDIAGIFRQVQTGQFSFYQWTGKAIRRFGPFSR